MDNGENNEFEAIMGTNYYWQEKGKCEICGREDNQIHIGKSSGGWCFSLHVDDEIKSLADWKKRFYQPGSVIKDEYDEVVAPKQMVEIITKRHWLKRGTFDYAMNNAEPGPNGLARHKIDGRHCIGHGLGTYDLIVGEFS